MAVIKQLNERDGIVKAIVEVNGVMVAVELNKVFKSHLERHEEVVRKARKAKVLLKDSSLTSDDTSKDAKVLIHEVAVQGELPADKILNTLGAEVLLGRWEAGNE